MESNITLSRQVHFGNDNLHHRRIVNQLFIYYTNFYKADCAELNLPGIRGMCNSFTVQSIINRQASKVQNPPKNGYNDITAMGGGWFPKLVWPNHNMVNKQVKVGVANNDKRTKCWCGMGKDGAATTTPAIRHSPPMITAIIILRI